LLDALVDRLSALLGDALVGIYLHGSMTMGCFNPESSDIDVLVVTTGDVPAGTRRAIGDALEEVSALAPPKGLELSIVDRSALNPFVYPTPFLLHFGGNRNYEGGLDPDLAAHATVTRARGECLIGAPIADVFGEVPAGHYYESVAGDARECLDGLDALPDGPVPTPVYMILNCCRVAAYRDAPGVQSKKEGGEWGVAHVPAELRPVVEAAAAEYARTGSAPNVEGADARAFAAWARERV
jgi:streptomycin 3"-adenylyltransferase